MPPVVSTGPEARPREERTPAGYTAEALARALIKKGLLTEQEIKSAVARRQRSSGAKAGRQKV